MDSKNRKKVVRIVIPVVITAVMIAVVTYGRDHLIAKRFAEVVPGQLYRSGYLEKWPLERVLDQHRIRTIVCLLNDEPENPRQKQEKEIAGRKGVRMVQIGMGGDGVENFDNLEKAAAILADASTHPVLVHCSAGVNRTGAVYAVWRMKYRGWDLTRALAEAERHGYDPKRNPKLAQHLARYYQERILTNISTSIAAE